MTSRIRLSPIEIDGVRVEREFVNSEYRAFCDICSWHGSWRMIWNDWEQLKEELFNDLTDHILATHSSIPIDKVPEILMRRIQGESTGYQKGTPN